MRRKLIRSAGDPSDAPATIEETISADPEVIADEFAEEVAPAETPSDDSGEAEQLTNEDPQPETESAYAGKQAILLSDSLNLAEIMPGLNCPQDWVEEALTHSCMEFARKFIERLSPTAKATPWLITSMTKDLTGQDRSDSQDHLSGFAMDLAPMYSDNIILPEDPVMLGLGWNVKSLILIGETQWGDEPLFVEGDHVHFSSRITPSKSGLVPIVWSDSDAYQSVRLATQDPVLNRLRRSMWLWDMNVLTLRGPARDVMEYCTSLLTKAE